MLTATRISGRIQRPSTLSVSRPTAPITFSSVPGEAYTGDWAGVQAAPYSTSRIPDGSWILSALLDADGDFQPLLSSNAGATCGDWVGAHVADLATGTIAPVDVSGGILLDDVTVTVGAVVSVVAVL